ncbi:MAG: head-tail adaptor protein [Armatimonadota bacterium]
MKINELSITVKRKTRTPDGAGGYTVSESTVGTHTGRLVRKTSPQMVEGAPGDVVLVRLSFVLPAGADVLAGDACEAGGNRYRVTAVRPYAGSVQADVEKI